MKKELAKQLKDAEFPQQPEEDFWSLYYDEKGNSVSFAWLPDPLMGGMLGQTKPAGYHYKIPTLEELIEACGIKLDSIERYGDANTWRAMMTEAAFDETGIQCFRDYHGYEIGDTPTEAVARLWLALNKKV